MINIKATGVKETEKLVYKTDDCISLSQGMMKVYGIPKAIKAHIQEMLLTEEADYYDNSDYTYKIKSKIADIVARRYETHLSPNQIELSHGCIGGITMSILSVLEAGDEVILPEPAYPLFKNIVKVAKGVPVTVSVLDENGIDWDIAVERIKKAVTSRTKVFLFSNPWNPLGCCIPKKHILDLVEWFSIRNIYIISDEVYEDYVFDKESFQSLVPLMANFSNIIRVTSFSKNFGIGGWRIGYVILPHKLQTTYEIVQHSLLVMPSQLSQIAADYVLDHPEISAHFHKLIYDNLLLSEKYLEPLVQKNYLQYVRPQGSFFLFLKTNEDNTFNRCMQMIPEAKVALIPGDSFGTSGAAYLRLCFARDIEVLEEGLKRFVDYWEKTEKYSTI